MFANKNWMKNLFHIFLILCFFFSNYACTTKTSDEGILFYREQNGEWDWHEDGDELMDSRKYEINFSSNSYLQTFNHKLFLKDKLTLKMRILQSNNV